ncbi:MAG: dihydrodipicolinate synthase family protein, partial [Pseudomonadales bacterium]|nr:dihydrodipicolinate synthase family protein [Pseudomonadales bacterium]
MPINPYLTRRQCLAGIAVTAAMPFTPVYAASGKAMRGALMILSTPYTESGEVDYEDLAKEVAFCDRCGVQGLVWPQNSSEQRYLSVEERVRGFEVLAEANRGRNMLLVLGLQAQYTAGKLQYAKLPESLSPD